MLSMINNFFKRNKKILTLTVFWVFLYFIFGDLSFAAEDDLLKSDWSFTDKWAETITTVFSSINMLITFLLTIMTYLSSLFLSFEWYSWTIFWLNDKFKEIWILVSNLVYFIFAFILIFIAFMNIIGRWWEKYELKKALPKMAIGILIVPFSWFFVNFILSVVSILSIAALNLPENSFPDKENSLNNIKIPKYCTIDVSSTNEWKYIICSTDDKYPKPVEDNDKETSLSLLFWKDRIFWTISFYIHGLIWIDELPDAIAVCSTDNDTSGCINTITDLVIKLVADFLFVFLYAILIIALWVVLMVRWIYMWIYLMLSPLFWLMYFFDKSWGGWEFFDKFNIKQFFSLAMVPVYTMLALSFGMLFVYVIWDWMIKDIDDTYDGSKVMNDNSITVWWEFELTVTWSVINTNSINKIFADGKDVWISIIWWLILQIFGITFLWLALMAALRSSEVTKAIVEPLHAFGGQVGGMLKTAPQYIPIFPGGQSMKSIQNIWTKASWYRETLTAEKWNKFAEKYGLFGADQFTSSMRTNIWRANWVITWSEVKNLIEKSFRDMWGDDTKMERAEFKELLDVLAKSDVVSPNFKNTMKKFEWQTTLSKDNVVEALKDLESNTIDLDLNGGAFNWDWITIPNLISFIKDWKKVYGSPSTNPTTINWIDGTGKLKYGSYDAQISTNNESWKTVIDNDSIKKIAEAISIWFIWDDLVSWLKKLSINSDDIDTELSKTLQYLKKDNEWKIVFVSDWWQDSVNLDEIKNPN